MDDDELVNFERTSRSRLRKHIKRDCLLQGKVKIRSGKCFGIPLENIQTAEEAPVHPSYNVIPDRIWYLISKHIEPEDVGRFALICKDTAIIVASREFWKNMYVKHCRKSTNSDMEKLRAKLARQKERDTQACLRHLTIRSLFTCHSGLLSRCGQPATLDWLVGQTLLLSNYHQCGSHFVIHLKFTRNYLGCKINEKSSRKESEKLLNCIAVNDWEELLMTDERERFHANSTQSVISASNKFYNPDEGESILLIECRNFSAGACMEALNQCDSFMYWRLQSYNAMLSSTLRDFTLHLTFNKPDNSVATIKLPSFTVKTIPWWHPQFLKENDVGFSKAIEEISFDNFEFF